MAREIVLQLVNGSNYDIKRVAIQIIAALLMCGTVIMRGIDCPVAKLEMPTISQRTHGGVMVVCV